MKLKVCGMKYNTEEIAALEPDYLGFIFWEPSARFFNGPASDLSNAIKKVGVFVNATLEEIVLHLMEYELQAVQLHGNESPNYCSDLKKLIESEGSGRPDIIKAFAIDKDFDFRLLTDYESLCDYFLFDTRALLPGGTGKRFDWKLLDKYTAEKPYFLSGGIGPEEVDSLKEFLEQPASKYCYAIDVNSRFEKEPGLKNKTAVQKFIKEMGIFKKETL